MRLLHDSFGEHTSSYTISLPSLCLFCSFSNKQVLVSDLLRCGGLPVKNLVLDQAHPAIVTEIHSGKLERRLVLSTSTQNSVSLLFDDA
jgi:hypothetical protein